MGQILATKNGKGRPYAVPTASQIAKYDGHSSPFVVQVAEQFDGEEGFGT